MKYRGTVYFVWWCGQLDAISVVRYTRRGPRRCGRVARGKRYGDGRGALSGLAATSTVAAAAEVCAWAVVAVVVGFRFAYEEQPLKSVECSRVPSVTVAGERMTARRRIRETIYRGATCPARCKTYGGGTKRKRRRRRPSSAYILLLGIYVCVCVYAVQAAACKCVCVCRN